MDDFPLIIIGGGPAGLMAAASAGNRPTLLIESGPKPGRKLLITAAGQCNITHRGSIPELLARYNGRERFLRPALYGFTNEEVIVFFQDRGVETFFDEKDRCLPRSLSARDVLHALLQACRDRGITLHQGDRVIAAEKTAGGFRVITKTRNFTCSRLIIATGGKSFPKTGSDGSGYQLAEQLGHPVIPPRPALTGIESDHFALVSLAGLSFEDRTIEVYRNGKRAGRYRGNLLITHKGLSGPVIINSSRNMRPGDELRLNFADLSLENLNERWNRSPKNGGSRTVGLFLKGLDIPRRLIPELLGSLDPEHSLSQVKKQDRIRLLNDLTAYPATLDRLQGWNTAMVTAGGADTAKIDPKTMESRLVKGLYFAGEVMDVDGDSGGYNLQAAFSTGFLAGQSAGNAEA